MKNEYILPGGLSAPEYVCDTNPLTWSKINTKNNTMALNCIYMTVSLTFEWTASNNDDYCEYKTRYNYFLSIQYVFIKFYLDGLYIIFAILFFIYFSVCSLYLPNLFTHYAR